MKKILLAMVAALSLFAVGCSKKGGGAKAPDNTGTMGTGGDGYGGTGMTYGGGMGGTSYMAPDMGGGNPCGK